MGFRFKVGRPESDSKDKCLDRRSLSPKLNKNLSLYSDRSIRIRTNPARDSMHGDFLILAPIQIGRFGSKLKI